MANNCKENYGWKDNAAPQCSGYIVPEIVKILSEVGATKVADVGSGNGTLCGALHRKCIKAIGIECDIEGYQLARQAYPELRFYNLSVQDDPSLITAKEGLFDAVVSTEVVEHLFSPHCLPIFASGLLKPGGQLIVTTPYHGYLKNLAISAFDKWDSHHTPLWEGGHIKFWSRDTLTTLLESNGFKVTKFYGLGRLPFLWKSMALVASKSN